MKNENKQNVMNKSKQEKINMWGIDKQMLPYKVHFFLYIGAMGALLPYYPSIGITRLGLGAGNLAVVNTVKQFLFIVFKPVICYAADYFNNLKEMIMALTVINGVLAFLLLAIPKVDDRNSIVMSSDSQFTKRPTHIAFCELCAISSELKAMEKYIPTLTDDFQDDNGCTLENAVSESFAGYCPKNSNSSIPFSIKLEIEIRTCYATKDKSKQSRKIDMNRSNNKSSTIFIKMYHHWISPELSLVCPNGIKISSEHHASNLTLNDIVTSCLKHPQDEIFPNNGTSQKYPSLSSNVICNHSEVTKDGEKLEIVKPNSFKTYQFWLYALLILLSCTCTSIIFTLFDTACYETAQKTGADFGRQRAWGAVGWGLSAPFSGFLNDYTNNYWAAMILMTILCSLQIWNLTKINLIKPQYSQSILKDVKTILSSAEFIGFEVAVFLNGMGIGIIFYFLAWFITDIGGSRLLIGLAHTVQCFLGEVPFMFLSGWLIRKIGHFNVVSMALFAHSIRFLAYSSLKDPWFILPIECLDGITFGAFYAAMTSYGKSKAKPGTEATTQSLLCSTYEGLGQGMGCVIAGACFDYYGGYTTFFYAGLCFALATVINLTSTAILHFKKRRADVTKETTCDRY